MNQLAIPPREAMEHRTAAAQTSEYATAMNASPAARELQSLAAVANGRAADAEGYETSDEAERAPRKPMDAASRLARANQRGIQRKATQRVPAGRYLVGGGEVPVTISPIYRQRISQTRRENFDNRTLGSIPKYSRMQENLNYPDAPRALFDPGFTPPRGLSPEQRMATGLAAAASNVSEPDKAGGADKLIRALARRHISEPGAPHPLDPAVNPMVTSAPYGRSVMSGATKLNADQQAAVDRYFSDSSDSEDPPFALRSGMLRLDLAAQPQAEDRRTRGRKRPAEDMNP